MRLPQEVAQIFGGRPLEDGGEEVEGLEDLEVALDAREEFRAVGAWESLGVVLLGAIDDLAVGADADKAGETEGAAGHVLGEALGAVVVACCEANAAVDVEAAVAPEGDLPNDGGLDAVGVEQGVVGPDISVPPSCFSGGEALHWYLKSPATMPGKAIWKMFDKVYWDVFSNERSGL